MKVSELKFLMPKVLMYSPAGTGKTGLALTLGGRCQYADLDGNIDVAFGLNDNLKTERLNVNVEQFLSDDPRKPTALRKQSLSALLLVSQL